MGKPLKVLLGAAGLLIVSVAVVLGYLGFQFTHSYSTKESMDVVFEVKPGTSFGTIASELEKQGLVKNAYFFSVYARLKGERSKVKVGEYMVKTDMVPSEILSILISGKSIERSFTVSEGLNLYEISALYESEGFGTSANFWKLAHDKAFVKTLLGEEHDGLEGYLFPETYMLTKYTTTKELIASMVRRFLFVYKEAVPQNEAPGWTRHQIVTLASIIEKETGAAEERPLISSVFHNRLKKGMRLQTDPTVLYGKAEKVGSFAINITTEDLRSPNRYNTYTIFGLPPGPIANPGREALKAVLAPAESTYLFFVSQNNGTHIFSSDYEAHNKAVKRFQLDPKAREGKSWRDLSKRKTEALAAPVAAPAPAKH
jgi:UPF0755 protein